MEKENYKEKKDLNFDRKATEQLYRNPKKEHWALDEIMEEFSLAYKKMQEIKKETTTEFFISIFGSARTSSQDKYYKLAEEIAYKLSCCEDKIGIITGGGPGIMEAANKGAQKGKGASIGLCIKLPFEKKDNCFIDPDKHLKFNFFFARKLTFIKYSHAFVVLPGGFGTLDELFEALTLIQTQKIKKFPVLLVGKAFWKGIFDWLKNSLINEEYINSEELALIRIVDSASEVVEEIEKFKSANQKSKENFAEGIL